MNATRRAVMGATSIGAVALLAGCGVTGNPLTTTVTVSLTNAQAEATAILTAVKVLAASAGAVLSKAAQGTLSNSLNVLETAVSEFVGLPSGSVSIAAFAGDVVTAIGAVTGVLPLAAATSVAIAGGVALLNALIAGLSAVTVAVVPASPATGAFSAKATTRIIAAPIPIPLA